MEIALISFISSQLWLRVQLFFLQRRRKRYEVNEIETNGKILIYVPWEGGLCTVEAV